MLVQNPLRISPDTTVIDLYKACSRIYICTALAFDNSQMKYCYSKQRAIIEINCVLDYMPAQVSNKMEIAAVQWSAVKGASIYDIRSGRGVPKKQAKGTKSADL